MSGKKYFPNNWQKWKDAPEDLFMPHTFDEIMDFKIAAWELPSNIACVIRESNITTKKVKEYVYQRTYAAERKVQQLLKKEGIEFTVCTSQQINFVSPLDPNDVDNNDDSYDFFNE